MRIETMAQTPTIMLGSSQGEFQITGDPIRADRFFGITDKVYTVSISLTDFTGRIWLEGSLAEDPRDNDCKNEYETDTDWFPIDLTLSSPFLDFEKKDGTVAYNFIGNFCWLRIRLDRSHIEPEPETATDLAELGIIKKVLLSC